MQDEAVDCFFIRAGNVENCLDCNFKSYGRSHCWIGRGKEVRDMSPTVGMPIQAITISAEPDIRPEPATCAAIVTDVHGTDCVSLVVFPGPYPDTEFFTPAEIQAGIAHRTSVSRGEAVGCWRNLPPPRD